MHDAQQTAKRKSAFGDMDISQARRSFFPTRLPSTDKDGRGPTSASLNVKNYSSRRSRERIAGGTQIELTKAPVAVLEYRCHQLSPPLAPSITRISQYDCECSRLLPKEGLTAFVQEES